MAITLYYHPLASFCRKVLVAVYELGVDVEKRSIDLADEKDRAELAAIWPLVKFPVIRDHVRQRDVPESFSMADCAAAPALFYAATLTTFPAGARHLKAYFERLVARPSVRRVLDEAKPYFSMYPFAEAIPARSR